MKNSKQRRADRRSRATLLRPLRTVFGHEVEVVRENGKVLVRKVVKEKKDV